MENRGTYELWCYDGIDEKVKEIWYLTSEDFNNLITEWLKKEPKGYCKAKYVPYTDILQTNYGEKLVF